jgi:hypothetical protein
VEENLVCRNTGKAPKWDANVVPNDYWVTTMLQFIDPHVSRGKINVTNNGGLNAPRNFYQHESRNQNKKANEVVAALSTVAAAKNKVYFPTQQRKNIAVNYTRKTPATAEKKKKVSMSIKNSLKRKTCYLLNKWSRRLLTPGGRL